jgi:hypothetical protein
MLRLIQIALPGILSCATLAQPLNAQAPSASRATTPYVLILPPEIISGERATLAVLDGNGKLAQGVTVNFSNGDRATTDKSGRALFVAPLEGVEISASIAGRSGRSKTRIRTATEVSAPSTEILTAPKFAAIGDRIELRGRSLCGDADANQVSINGQRALVLASSPLAVTVAPPPDLAPGRAKVEFACGKSVSAPFFMTFLEMELRADSTSLKPGEHRWLSVHVKGTSSRVPIEATNLAPKVAEMVGGNSLIARSSGGSENVARIELIGKTRGSFQVTVRLLPTILKLR